MYALFIHVVALFHLSASSRYLKTMQQNIAEWSRNTLRSDVKVRRLNASDKAVILSLNLEVDPPPPPYHAHACTHARTHCLLNLSQSGAFSR